MRYSLFNRATQTALIALSASGLIIGILAYVAYHVLNIMVDRVILKMETDAVEFIDLLEEPGR